MGSNVGVNPGFNSFGATQVQNSVAQGAPVLGSPGNGLAAPAQTAVASPQEINLINTLTLMAEMTKTLLALQNGGVGAADAAAPPATLAPPTAVGGRPKIVQIDNFTPDGDGFNHGAEVAETLTAGGDVDLQQMDISQGNSISGSLQQVIAQVQAGEQVDAVNLSLQDLQGGPEAQETQQAIDTLVALGVPVIIAAGNGGRGSVNQLADNDAFIVESLDANGQVNASSGQGNGFSAVARTTSFAAPQIALQAARLRAQGLSVAQIGAQLRGF